VQVHYLFNVKIILKVQW